MPLNDNDLLLINDSQDSFEAKKIKYSTLKQNISTDVGASDLQAVTDKGNTTNKGATFGETLVAKGFDVSPDLNPETVGGAGLRVQYGDDIADNVSFVGGRLEGRNIAFGHSGNGTSVLASINTDGSGTFTGKVTSAATAAGDGATTLVTKGYVDGLGSRTLQQVTEAGNTTDQGINIDNKILLNADGTSKFTGDFNINDKVFIGAANGNISTTSTGWFEVVKNSTNSTLYMGASDVEMIQSLQNGDKTFILNNNGSAWFKGDVTSDGTIGFNLEANNPANYNAQGEYTGPVLNIKERVQNLISRLDALEANEVIDDAVDTSLLSLLASASSRLDSIEARLNALEGGN